jgi:hypothetical protein
MRHEYSPIVERPLRVTTESREMSYPKSAIPWQANKFLSDGSQVKTGLLFFYHYTPSLPRRGEESSRGLIQPKLIPALASLAYPGRSECTE